MLIVSSSNSSSESELDDDEKTDGGFKSPPPAKRPETLKKEIVVLPWIDLDKLSVVNSDKDLATVEEDQVLRQKLLLSSAAAAASGKNSSDHSRDPEAIVDWLKKHQLSVEFQAEKETIAIQGGLVKLKSPYTANDCQATNLIVLDRVTSILAQMPPANL